MTVVRVLVGLAVAACLAGLAPAPVPHRPASGPAIAIQDPDDLALRRERAARLMAMLDVDESVQSVIAVMPQLLEPAFAEMPAEERAEAQAIMKAVMAEVFPEMFEELMTASIDIYADRFTLEELDAMIAFYETDVGQSIMRKSAVAGAEIAAVTQQLMPRYMLRMFEAICERVKCPAQPRPTSGK